MSSSGGPKNPRPLHSNVQPKGRLLNLANVIPQLNSSTTASIRILIGQQKEKLNLRIFFTDRSAILFIATAGLVLVQVVDPAAAQQIAEHLAGLVP